MKELVNRASAILMALAMVFVFMPKTSGPVYADNKFSFVIHKGKCPKDKETLKMGRGATFRCPVCGEVTLDGEVCGREGRQPGRSEFLPR